MIQKQDVVLCISNSGNSPEIANLVPYLKDYSSALIGMTGNKKSKLAEFSEVILDTHVDIEACPNKTGTYQLYHNPDGFGRCFGCCFNGVE